MLKSSPKYELGWYICPLGFTGFNHMINFDCKFVYLKSFREPKGNIFKLWNNLTNVCECLNIGCSIKIKVKFFYKYMFKTLMFLVFIK